MSSYYDRVIGYLQPNKTARVEDINLIQTNIEEALRELITDILGTNFILGENEDDLKLVPTTDYIDQANYNYSDAEEKTWFSFYGSYLRQGIYITKSSIESITLHMKNTTQDVDATIYAEIRDSDFDLIKETNTVLSPTGNQYTEVTFNFNIDHLPVGLYYFVLRPVDVAATNLQESVENQISPNQFVVKIDVDGQYHKNINELDINESGDIEEYDIRGLEASLNGSTYIDAYLLPNDIAAFDNENLMESDEQDPNYDLYFEEAYSSGNTYLVNTGEAVIFGEKVDAFDTHIKINEPSDSYNRTDLVVLTKEGKLKVINGPGWNGEQIYPDDNSGLKIAYITTYKNGEKVSTIEQSDENDMTRGRDILERIRRLEKKITYQMENNSPSRIKYGCQIDPVLFQNSISASKDKEGSYNIGLSTNKNGDAVAKNKSTTELIWSIIKKKYTYSYEEIKTTDAFLETYNVDALAKTMKTGITSPTEGLYTIFLSTHKITNDNPTKTLQHPIKNESVKVVIKKGKTIKETKTVTTNNKGKGVLNLTKLKLPAGSYTIETTISKKTIKNKLTVHKSSYKAQVKDTVTKITLIDTKKESKSAEVKDNIIAGDDSFERDNIVVDVDNGIVELSKVNNSSASYTKNTPLTKTGSFKNNKYSYKIYSNKKNLKSEFPILHLKFDSDTYIKSITPHIKQYKNISKLGIILFKNDKIESMRKHKRNIIEKNLKKDVIFPNVFKAERALDDINGLVKVKKDGQQTLANFVTFTPKTPLHLEAGTYSLMVYAKLKKGKDEGIIYIDEYETLGNLEEYGLSAKCTGSSNLSTVRLNSNNLTSRSWNVVIEQKKDKYYKKGTITSIAKDTSADIKSCHVVANTNIPKGCWISLYVSNDGGKSWVKSPLKGTVKFSGYSHIFKWKMILESNEKDTPQLLYKQKSEYAIKFTLDTESKDVGYEDFGSCYESPLLNANSITKIFVRDGQVTNRFSEWEFARIYMLDDDDDTKIDLCISYANDNNTTGINTVKDKWGKDIFFSQIFADLKLSDFNTTSIDYDNYDGNVEFDEHNYPFRKQSEYSMLGTGGTVVATPNIGATTSEEDNSVIFDTKDCEYGNINTNEAYDIINNHFVYEDEDNTFTYVGNEEDDTKQYAGMHLINGPYKKALFSPKEGGASSYKNITDENKYKYIINGVTFNNALEVDRTKTELRLELYPISDEEGHTFAKNTFDVVVALTPDGTLSADNRNGKVYPIDTPLQANQFNTVYIDLSDDIDGYASGIHSIGIKLHEEADMQQGEGMGIGIISTYSYVRRPYLRYMYSGYWDRLQWQGIKDSYEFYNIIRPTKTTNNKTTTETCFYPTFLDENRYEQKTTNLQLHETENDVEKTLVSDGLNLCYKKSYTNMEKEPSKTLRTISRTGSVISATVKDTSPEPDTTTIYTTNNTGNAVLFKLPAKKTGLLFKVDVDVPLSLYDLVGIEYYMYYTKEQTTDTDSDKTDNIEYYDGYKYTYDGSFSKGEILINFYSESAESVTDATVPMETLALPSWGLVQQRAQVTDKLVHAWFKINDQLERVKCIGIARANPRNTPTDEIPSLKIILDDIMFYSNETMPALGPQMQMRIYPSNLSDIEIRKIGCVYRI